MVYVVFYTGDTISQSVLCLLPDLSLDNGDTEGGGKADHGEKRSRYDNAELTFYLDKWKRLY